MVTMEQNIENASCPLCHAAKTREFSKDARRDYLACEVCSLVFVPAWQFLSAEEEKRRYDQHRNSPENSGYRRFLSRMLIPLQERLTPGSRGLDFGSGPEPVLSGMFEAAGYSMAIFDYFYAHDPAVFEKQYDFITATEVVEHLHDPKGELDRLWACLKHGGRLGIMTKLAVEQNVFPQWYYKNDLTHVCFFSRPTFAWLAGQWNADLMFSDRDAVLFRKKTSSSSSPLVLEKELPE